MALCIYFAVGGMTPDRYDEVQKALQAAGQGAPAGRSYHVAFKSGGDLHVVDVWDSMEQFETFGETLMPILAEQGIDPGTPEIADVYNVIVG